MDAIGKNPSLSLGQFQRGIKNIYNLSNFISISEANGELSKISQKRVVIIEPLTLKH